MMCLQFRDDEAGYCSPYCSVTDPARGCADAEACAQLGYGDARTYACYVLESQVDGGADAPPEVSVSDANSEADRAQDLLAPIDGGYPAEPGIYLTITATAMKGTHAMTQDVVCALAQGSPEVTANKPASYSMNDNVRVATFKVPEAGATYSSPSVQVSLTFMSVSNDMGVYPGLGGLGSCTLIADQGWPALRARFSCTGLVGSGSKTPFEIVNGMVVCP
jgi:hypothetical protein